MIELQKIKNYLGIKNDNDDLKLQKILDEVICLIKNNVGDLKFGTKKMQVKNSQIKNNTISLNIINPTKILKINGFDFSNKINLKDYFIQYDGNCIIKDLENFLQNDFGIFEVEFEAGFTETPADLIGIVSNYIAYLSAKENGKDIVNQQLGPRSVSFGDNSGNSDNDGIPNEFKIFKKGLEKYIPICLKIY